MALVALPRLLKNFNIYLDGDSYAGRCDSVTLPNITAVVESHRAGGMNGSVEVEVEVELGLELMTMSLVISDFDPKLVALFNQANLPITLRGSVQAQHQKGEPVVINIRGLHKGLEFGDWSGGSKSTQTLQISLNYFRYRQKDVEYAEIDLLNMVQKIGGIDQLADDRASWSWRRRAGRQHV